MARRVKPLIHNTHPAGHADHPAPPEAAVRPDVVDTWSFRELEHPWLRLSALVDSAGEPMPVRLTPGIPSIGEIIELPGVDEND